MGALRDEVRMKAKLIASLALSAGLLAAGRPILAHHGTAAYEDKITEFKQVTVTRFAWANPHTLIDFDVKNAHGEVAHWVCETAAPQALRLIGWGKASIEPGQVVSIYLYVAKNGNPVGRLQKIVLADGTELHDTVLGGDSGGKTRYDPDPGK
jgi:hypothetical protein